jgi:hypothetical protein
MSEWKDVFISLNKCNEVFARWYLREGGYIYMYIPELEEISDDGFSGESFMRFEEISKIEIPRNVKHGNLKISNNIEAVELALNNIDGFIISRHENGLAIQLS